MQPSAPNRTSAIGICLFVAGLGLTFFLKKAGSITIAAGLFFIMCAGAGEGFRALLTEARDEWRHLWRQARVRVCVLRRRARDATRPRATLVLAWQALIVMMLAIVLAPATGVSAADQKTAFDTAMRVAMTVALVDLMVMGVGAMRWPWARTAGKGLKAMTAAIIGALAFAAARRVVFDIVGEDPLKFPGAITVVGLLCLPLAWAAVAAFLAALTVLPMMVWKLVRLNKQQGTFVAKCADGVRLVLIALAVGWGSGQCGVPDFTHHPRLREVGLAIVVGMDFWPQPACGGDRVLSARVSDNRYLVANKSASGIDVQPLACPPGH